MSLLKRGMGSRVRFRNDRKRVVLLMHCYTGIPGLFDELAEMLYKRGYSYYNLRLPGHGLSAENGIFQVKRDDWLFYAENILLDLMDSFEEVYLCGLSLGGVISYSLLVKYGERVKRAALLSPLFRPKGFNLLFAALMHPFIKRIPYLGFERYSTIPSEHYKDFIPFFPFPQAYYVLRLARKNAKMIHRAIPPTLAFLAVNDNDFNYLDQKVVMERNKSIRLEILEKSFHQITVDVEKDYVHQRVVDFFDRH